MRIGDDETEAEVGDGDGDGWEVGGVEEMRWNGMGWNGIVESFRGRLGMVVSYIYRSSGKIDSGIRYIHPAHLTH